MEVRTAAGTYGADQVVVAAGVWSREICRSLGVDIDLAPGRAVRRGRGPSSGHA
ncbi:hypothetical protein ACWCQW_36795 [Streptomyces mirabilis]